MWDDLDKDLQIPGGQCWGGGGGLCILFQSLVLHSRAGERQAGGCCDHLLTWMTGWQWKKLSLAGTLQSPMAQLQPHLAALRGPLYPGKNFVSPKVMFLRFPQIRKMMKKKTKKAPNPLPRKLAQVKNYWKVFQVIFE